MVVHPGWIACKLRLSIQIYPKKGATMKTLTILFLLISVLLVSCNGLTIAGQKVIIPSDVVISENRQVSGFNKIQFTCLGKVNMIQGDQESLNISGPDNVVPEIVTEVRNGVLVIRTKENTNINPLKNDNPLTFTIVFKDLVAVNVSGAGDVQVESFTTPSLEINLSGAGKVIQNQVSAEKLSINLSGVGGIEVSGQAGEARIEISGTGSVYAPDLQIQTADVTISGLGGATLWVTEQLTGNISGAGSVSYYGNPQTNTTASGVGQFKSLGSK
jgi:hypothetical protein